MPITLQHVSRHGKSIFYSDTPAGFVAYKAEAERLSTEFDESFDKFQQVITAMVHPSSADSSQTSPNIGLVRHSKKGRKQSPHKLWCMRNQQRHLFRLQTLTKTLILTLVQARLPSLCLKTCRHRKWHHHCIRPM